MAGAPKTVKDVASHEFVTAYAAYLRSTGKVNTRFIASCFEPFNPIEGGGSPFAELSVFKFAISWRSRASCAVTGFAYHLFPRFFPVALLRAGNVTV
jgi:hypothetical protein